MQPLVIEVHDLRCGAPVRGTVRVVRDEALPAARLRVFMRRSATYRVFEPTPEHTNEHVLGPFGWRAGEESTQPFDLGVLAGPPSYDGARAKVGWAIVCELISEGDVIEVASEPVVVGNPIAQALDPTGYRDAPAASAGELSWPERPLGLIIGSEAPVDPAVDWIRRFYERIAGWVRPSVTIDVKPRHVSPGGDVEASIMLRSRSAVTVEDVTLTLIGRETGTHLNESDETILYRDEKHPIARTRFEAGTQTFRSRFTVPASAAASFDVNGVTVDWIIEARVELDVFADAFRRFRFSVSPS